MQPLNPRIHAHPSTWYAFTILTLGEITFRKLYNFQKKDRFYNLLVRLVHLMRLFELSGQECLGKTCRTLSKSISLHLSSDLIYSPKLIVFLELCSRNKFSFLRTGNMSMDKLWSLFFRGSPSNNNFSFTFKNIIRMRTTRFNSLQFSSVSFQQ